MSFIKDKVVLITGGSSGIGKACAERFGREGGRICITGRNAENLEAAAAELRAKNIEVLTVQGDVANENDCVRMINQTLNTYGRIDVLINNAGITMRAFFKSVDLSVIRQLMEVNFFGTVYCTKYALRQLLKYNGSVVGVSSVAGYQGLPGRSGYSASKFAMEGFLKALRLENHNTGLHVMIVCPGYTESNIRKTALIADGSAQGESPRDEPKMMSSEEVADHIFNGVKNRKQRVVLTAQGKLSFYLSKLFPGIVDKLVIKAIEKEGELPK
ncbi:MAG: SDR family oxidoreductase [Flavobacteriales bacterium]|jgi:short-subunit dehydrogenase|nr:SDR family oxidoreductase [Flavobacteriales bacterium]